LVTTSQKARNIRTVIAETVSYSKNMVFVNIYTFGGNYLLAISLIF